MDDQRGETHRWGREGRDRKAVAILDTVIRCCGEQVVRGKWLDIGCGSGGIASALAPHVDKVIGIDPEPWASWSDASVAHANLSFLVASCDDSELPVAERSADVVICNQVYEHVTSPERLIQNLHRILKPGGCCYFAGPNLLWPVEPHVKWPFVHWLPRRPAQRAMALLGSSQATELDAYSSHCWRLQRWFSGAGFEWEDVVPARFSVGMRVRGHGRLAGILDAVPKPCWRPFKPFWPGFIFILRKRRRDSDTE